MTNIHNRLDYDSEGFVLLTNNMKGITQKLLHPQKKHERTYLVQLEGIITKVINTLSLVRSNK